LKITVIGTGYVGLVTGTCLAEVGNEVLCLDVDPNKIEILKSGGIPIYEPGLEDMVKRNVAAGRLSFTTDIEESVAFGQIQFIAVGTPPDEDGSADLQYVVAAARNIGRHMSDYKLVVDKSTVPVGTADKVRAALKEELATRGTAIEFNVASNPEFLKEGAAVDDFMKPDRIVIGTDSERATQLLRQLYAPFQRNHDRLTVMDVRSAELTKYAANAMLATRISFMNELAVLAEKLGADIEQVRHGIGSDPRIGYHFLYAGCGYGGSCFPKDVQALRRTGQENGIPLRVLDAVEEANDAQKHILVNKLTARFGTDLKGKRFAMWGLAFKPNTDDARSPQPHHARSAVGDGRERVGLRSGRNGGNAPHLRRARRPAAGRQPDGRAERRRRALDRHRMEGLPQPQLRHHEVAAEDAAGIRRPQPVRAAGDARDGLRLPADRTPVMGMSSALA